jgi:thiamine-phosphate pyrophosphorylase
VSPGPPRARPSAVYAIADVGILGAARAADAVVAMAEAGIGTVQLRSKRLDDAPLAALCEELLRRLAAWPGGLWIDDRVDLAAALPFQGVHLGQSDLPPREARALLPSGRLVGSSTHDASQLAAGDADEAVDWLALGPIFPTASKDDPDPVVGLAELARLRPRTRKPLVAIGGIDAGNVASVLAAGADAAAVLSAVCRGDVAANCRRLLRAAEAAA